MDVSGLLVGHNESTDAGKAAEQGHQHRQIVLPVFRLIVDLPDGELLAGSQPQCDQQHQQEPPCGKGKGNCRIGVAAVQSDRGIDVFELELQHVNFFIGLHGKLQRVIAAGRLCLCSLFESLCQVVVFHGEGNLIHLVLAVRMQPDTVQLVPVQIRKGQGAVAGNGDLALVVERSCFLIADFCGGKGKFLFGFLGGEAGDVEHQHFQQKDAAGNAGGFSQIFPQNSSVLLSGKGSSCTEQQQGDRQRQRRKQVGTGDLEPADQSMQKQKHQNFSGSQYSHSDCGF